MASGPRLPLSRIWKAHAPACSRMGSLHLAPANVSFIGQPCAQRMLAEKTSGQVSMGYVSFSFHPCTVMTLSAGGKQLGAVIKSTEKVHDHKKDPDLVVLHDDGQVRNRLQQPCVGLCIERFATYSAPHAIFVLGELPAPMLLEAVSITGSPVTRTHCRGGGKECGGGCEEMRGRSTRGWAEKGAKPWHGEGDG